MPFHAPSLALCGCLSLLCSLALRSLLRPLGLKPESKHRLTASAASVAVLCSVAWLGNDFGCATLLGYMFADLGGSLVWGPATTPLMLAHHGATIFLTVSGLLCMRLDSPSFREVVRASAAALLWMEASNPFLHACMLLEAEPALAGLKLYLLPAAVPGLLLTYLWYRVLAIPACLPAIWEHRAQLAPMGEAYAAVVSLLAALQLYWYALIVRKVARAVCCPRAKGSAAPGGEKESKD
jgi:hypothetical protein